MFTGIIEELATVKTIKRQGKIYGLELSAGKVADGTKIGDSIAVNGVCLTVVKIKDNVLSFDIMKETFAAASLSSLKITDKVNLESALKAGDKISGHFVTGHIDCVGVIRRKNYVSDNLGFEIAVPQKFSKYLIPKGSVAIDGISLTLQKTKGNTFWVYIIPHTLESTTLAFRLPSHKVNIEIDMLAKRK